MAEQNEYIDEAYQALMKLSADDRKRLEYEYHQRAIRDYNTQMRMAEKRGREAGEARGEAKGEARGRAEGIAEGEAKGESKGKKIVAKRLFQSGMSEEKVAALCDEDIEKVRNWFEEWT